MRKARNNQSATFHHVVVRAAGGQGVFAHDDDKRFLLHILWEHGQRHGIEYYAWCILPDSLHLLLFDGPGHLSRMMKEVNGRFGSYYRRRHGGEGVVFHDRYRSEPVEDAPSLAGWLAELLLLPVRRQWVASPDQYPWTSIHEVFPIPSLHLTEAGKVETLFGEPGIMIEFLRIAWAAGSLEGHSARRRERTLASLAQAFRRLRGRVPTFGQLSGHLGTTPEARTVIRALEEEYSVRVAQLEKPGWENARIRGELLIRLRDDCRLSYAEIHKLRPFRSLALNSLGNLYRRARQRRQE